MPFRDDRNLDARLSVLVTLAGSAVAKEDALLRGFLDACTEEYGFYENWPHGVTCLYEQPLVYVILRELLGSRFPYEIGWEQPYPGASQQHADLCIKVDGQMRACIECKWWLREDGGEIKQDLDKMSALPSEVRRFVLVAFWNDTLQQIHDNVNWLREKFGLRPVPPSPCTFHTKVLRNGQHIENFGAVAMFEHSV